MTAFQLLGPLPLVTLDAGCTITLEAIDPHTGAAVTGVTVSLNSIYGVNDVPEQAAAGEPNTLYTVLAEPVTSEIGGG